MSSLRELQRDFFDALRQPAANDRCIDRVLPADIPAHRRLQIYRNHHRVSLAGALSACFPVVERLVGTECFAALARQFVETRPPRAGQLLDYGRGFPTYLAGAQALTGLEYVAEVAALEWLRQEAYHAEDAPRLHLARLAEVPPAAQEDLRLGLHPSVRLLRSPYPVVSIWRTNHHDAEPEVVNLASGGENALVWRSAAGIEVRGVDAATAALIGLLQSGEPFSLACEAALNRSGAFDPGQALARLCGDGVISTASWSTNSDDAPRSAQGETRWRP